MTRSLPALALAAVALVGCSPATTDLHPSYDPVTRGLIRLDVDQDGDGRVDVRTYLAGSRPLRAELDQQGRGLVDRWEYFDTTGQLVLVGTSSLDDGIEDTWTHAPAAGERRVELSTARDRRVDRREYYREEALTRSEEDVNGDGRPDRWDTWEDGVLRAVAFDTSYALGRPDRRLVYGADGMFSHVEADLEGDGRFQRTEPESPAGTAGWP